MAHTQGHSEIRNPGPLKAGSGLKTLFAVFAVVGFAVTAFTILKDPARGWSSFLMNHFYFMSLALGGLFIAAIQHLTSAMWSAPVRRISESFTAYLPIVFVGFLLIAIPGLRHLFIWADPAHVQGDVVLEHKAGYLSSGFFIVRNLVAIVLWVLFAKKIVGHSVAQDQDGDYAHTAKNKVFAPIFIMIFAITFTMASFDQMMSLDPHWFSTMFGVYTFAGLFYASLALTTIITVLLKRSGGLAGIVNDNHLHDLGKFMFAFTVFWAYIGFSQFMLIWYANLPEETMYFMHRMTPSWMWMTVFLLVGKFMVPFFALLPRDAKRSESRLLFVGAWMLFAQWMDLVWIVQPEFFKDGPKFLVEILTFLGFAGVFGLAVLRFLSKHSIVAIKDPKLAEAVFHHHQ